MKHSLFFLAMCLMCCACSSDENIGGTSAVKNISATLEPMTFDGQTRTSHTVSDTQGFLSEWAEGDILGIYPVGGDQVAFPISAGAGTSTAKFDGGSWALRPAVKYSAYYPFSKDNYMISQTEIPVNYEGQSQNGNASTEHLGNYYYVAAAATEPTSTGSVNLAMKHMGSLLNLILTMPVAASYTDVVVETEVEGDYFPTTGTIDLTSTTPAITPKTYAHSIHLGLSNVSTAAANQTISLLMMMAPANMQDKNLLVTVTDAEGKTYQFKGAGKTYLAAKAYRLTLTEVIGGTGANLTPDGWDDSDPNMHNGHEYVDLGLPSGTLWATCNVGAKTSTGYGSLYSWGEVNSKQSYKLADYQYYQNGNYINIGSSIKGTSYDVAHIDWGGDWTMPSKAELAELRDECTWTWETRNGVSGYKVQSSVNDNYIFMPASGCSSTSEHGTANNYGSYWTSSLSTSDEASAYYIFFGQTEFVPNPGAPNQTCSRIHGHSIRPVISQNMHKRHEYVDLGIKDDQGRTIYWATCNVGASSPEEYGYYFKWGENNGHSKDGIVGYEFSWANAPFNNGNFDYIETYFSSVKNTVCPNGNLALDYDAARQNWGGSWRMPTLDEFIKLYEYCTWEWNSIKMGYNVTGPNGSCIFLPAAGRGIGNHISYSGTGGGYWSRTLHPTSSDYAHNLSFSSDKIFPDNDSERYFGLSVRPVAVIE